VSWLGAAGLLLAQTGPRQQAKNEIGLETQLSRLLSSWLPSSTR
jgi:hypothetical protein